MRLRFETVEICDYLLLYKAFKRLSDFVANSKGVAVHREILANLHLLEVRVQRPVAPKGDRYELAVEHPRIALAIGRRKSFRESVMLVIMKILTDNVTFQNARVTFSRLHHTLSAKDSFQVDAKRRVAVPTLLLIIIFRWRG